MSKLMYILDKGEDGYSVRAVVSDLERCFNFVWCDNEEPFLERLGDLHETPAGCIDAEIDSLRTQIGDIQAKIDFLDHLKSKFYVKVNCGPTEKK